MGDVTVRRIECDGCGAVEEVEQLGQPNQRWTRVALYRHGRSLLTDEMEEIASGAPEDAVWHRTLCETCADRLIGKLDDLRAEAERLKGGKAPRGWP